MRLRIVFLILLIACLACGVSPGSTGGGLNEAAADFQGDYWFHVTKPLTLDGLQGKVILIDVWQFT